MKIPVLGGEGNVEKYQYLDFLYHRIRLSYCNELGDCVDCPFYDAKNPSRDCSKLSHEQMDSILIAEFRKAQEVQNERNNESKT